MATDRRHFIRTTAAAAAALGAGLGAVIRPDGLAASPTPDRPGDTAPEVPSRPHRALRLLILGGTGFIGPWQVRYALERGHEVTLFNRGRTAPDMFPGVETLIGDRDDDLQSLRGRTWDAVIDNAQGPPEWVRRSASFLKDSVDQYLYTSTRSTYADTSRVPMTADVPTWTYETADVEPGAENLPYGLRKALSEREAQAAMPGRVTIVRPGLIIGPGDETDRFTYWPVRIHRGGEVLAPGDPSDPVQIIDVRDLTEWMVRLLEQGDTGVFNGVGPATPRPMAELLYGIRAVTTAETTFTWVDTDVLLEQGVRPYSHMPVWMPPRDGREGFARFDLSKEVAHGLTFRPLADTTRATLDYHVSRSPERQADLRAGISAEREAEVLAAWHEHVRTGSS